MMVQAPEVKLKIISAEKQFVFQEEASTIENKFPSAFFSAANTLPFQRRLKKNILQGLECKTFLWPLLILHPSNLVTLACCGVIIDELLL